MSENLTAKYVLEAIPWPEEVRERLSLVERRLAAFRKYIEPARSKRLAHTDLHAPMIDRAPLGSFPEGADRQFVRDLQEFIDIAMAHVDPEGHKSINVGGATDVYLLVRALEKSLIFDQYTRCTEAERSVAILDYEDRS